MTASSPRRAARAPDTPFYVGDHWSADESIGYLLRQGLTAVVRALDARVRPCGLTSTQWSPLMAIARGGNVSAATLARDLNTDTGAITRMLDRLERKGLLTRCRSEDDRRVVKLALTDAGRNATRQVPYVLAEVLNEHLHGFSQEEFTQLKLLLRRFIANGAANGAGAEGQDA